MVWGWAAKLREKCAKTAQYFPAFNGLDAWEIGDAIRAIDIGGYMAVDIERLEKWRMQAVAQERHWGLLRQALSQTIEAARACEEGKVSASAAGLKTPRPRSSAPRADASEDPVSMGGVGPGKRGLPRGPQASSDERGFPTFPKITREVLEQYGKGSHLMPRRIFELAKIKYSELTEDNYKSFYSSSFTAAKRGKDLVAVKTSSGVAFMLRSSVRHSEDEPEELSATG